MPHQYLITGWFWLHRVSAFGGALAFAVAGAAGGDVFAGQLPTEVQANGGLPELWEALNAWNILTLLSITLGFGLLTIGLITGVVRMLGGAEPAGAAVVYIKPKVLLTFIAWVVYALVFCIPPINPSFRGPKSRIAQRRRIRPDRRRTGRSTVDAGEMRRMPSAKCRLPNVDQRMLYFIWHSPFGTRH